MSDNSQWSPPVRVLVVDDQSLFRVGLTALLRGDSRVTVVGSARDGAEAVERAGALLPDVVLMDVRMPGLDGIRATARIVKEHPSVRVLMLASLQPDEAVVNAIRAGASGYVLKDIDRAGLVDAVLQAAAGRQILGAAAQMAVVRSAFGRAAPPKPPHGLTLRQLEILKLMSTGVSIKQIARELGVAEKTVRNQASLMYSKLRVHDRVQAILFAVHKGLVA
jgi:DNA-binding NarL/FixJ family response regulator